MHVRTLVNILENVCNEMRTSEYDKILDKCFEGLNL